MAINPAAQTMKEKADRAWELLYAPSLAQLRPLRATRDQITVRNNPNKGEKVMININMATQITDEDLKKVMDYHPWDEAKIKKGQVVKDALSVALKVIIENVPPCPDRSAAIRKLRDCRMDCNSAITHDGNL